MSKLHTTEFNVTRDQATLRASVDLSEPRPMKVCFPVILDGDLVLSPEHLGVSYLVSILRESGAECRIVEVSGSRNEDPVAIEEIKDFSPDLVGFSLTTVLVDHATDFGLALRQALDPSAFFLAGGPLATFKGKDLLSNPKWEFLDALIRGEGDVPIVRFAEAFWSNAPMDSVPNLTWRDADGNIKSNPYGVPVGDLDLLPEPARDQMEIRKGKLPYLRIATTRGCTARCTFCNAPHAGNKLGPGKLWRGRDPRKVVDEIERLYERFNFNTFDFVDSTFEDPGGTPAAKKRIAEIAHEILNRDLSIFFNCCVQARNWSEDDVGLIDLLHRSGLEKVLIGVESGSEAGLRRWNKKSSKAENVRAIELFRDSDVYVAFGFISYHPWSSFEEVRENIKFLSKYMGHNLRRFTVRLELYPGAEVVELLRKDGLLHREFDRTLDPLSYRYEDPRVGKLASTSALLYGEQYRDQMVVGEESPVFTFETFDILLHTFFSRLKRKLRDDQDIVEIVEDAQRSADLRRAAMCDFNYELMSELTAKAEAGTLNDANAVELRPKVEQYYRQELAQFRTLQLQTGKRLHRAGVDMASIRST